MYLGSVGSFINVAGVSDRIEVEVEFESPVVLPLECCMVFEVESLLPLVCPPESVTVVSNGSKDLSSTAL